MKKKISASWNDIEITLNDGTLEDKDNATLEAFNRIEAPPSTNPIFIARYNEAKARIRHRLSELTEQLGLPLQTNNQGEGIGEWFVGTSHLIREIRKNGSVHG